MGRQQSAGGDPALVNLDALPLSAIRRISAVDAVEARIVLAVQLGLLMPGDRLPPPAVASTALGVSDASVRRAYRSLNAKGVLRSARGRAGGTFVAAEPGGSAPAALAAYQADRARVHALIDERAALEAGLAAVAAHAPDGASLTAMHDEIRRMHAAQDWATFREADAGFHDLLASAAGMPAAARLHRRISRELYAYFLPYPIAYLHASNEEHVHLLDALERRDSGRAALLARAHVAELHRSMYVGQEQRASDERSGPEPGAMPRSPSSNVR
ncbi:FadR/GntR family transcriptional regulator [Microbacterium sp. NPDC056052]|uniref:FadR/GntR family transcriptional regulator n=1 Tax=Microbacterium sp. NPDC056052 TaxID=3345695 RepID=UPI0035D89242